MNERAVFLDRDGTINRDTGYPVKISDLALLPGAASAIMALNKAGFKVVVISNQSGIGRGLFGHADVESFNTELNNRLIQLGAVIDAYYYCPHAPAASGEPACDCRKPGAGLLRQASDELEIDLHSSFMVGDKFSDIVAGAKCGCRTILLDKNDMFDTNSGIIPDHESPDLTAAVQWILSQVDKHLNERAK